MILRNELDQKRLEADLTEVLENPRLVFGYTSSEIFFFVENNVSTKCTRLFSRANEF